MSTVDMIPATKRSLKAGSQLREQTGIRVAAYCRVSTGDESQQTSYTNQKAFYTGYINNQKGWEMAGIYADEAISGTSRAHRQEFNRMIADAMSGRIDYIVTKSISRFARNTVDTLNCVRQLRQQNPPVGIFFEKENIDTLDAAGELILTILSALAQDESRSISENIRWTIQKNFQAGKPQINLNRMLGYDKGENGEWVINSAQAEIIRFLFQKYSCGHSANSIAKQANEAGMRTVNGKLWRAGAVLEILRNEKYAGDLEMQKTITRDFLTHRSVKNTGEVPKYYVKNHHAGIIDRFTWEKVQMMLGSGRAEKTKDRNPGKRGPKGSPFSNLICGELMDGKECGSSFFRMTYSSIAEGYHDERDREADAETQTRKYIFAYPVWRCRGKYRKKQADDSCPSTVLQECALEQSFMEMLYWLKKDYETGGAESWLETEFKKVYDNVRRRMSVNHYSHDRMEILEGQIQELEDDLANNPPASAGRQHELCLQLDSYRRERTVLKAEQNAAAAIKQNYDFFIECLKGLPALNPATDYLRFDRGIYAAFIQNGKVRGDEIEYMTNFGLDLKSYGNKRTLKDFLGYRRYREDGSVELLDALWKVNGKKVQHRPLKSKDG